MRWAPAFLLLGLLASESFAQDISLESVPTRWRITFDDVDEGTDESLGLLGVSLDLLEPVPSLPELYAGVGVYSAVTGDRGGFFVGGVSAGWLREIRPGWSVDAGFFFGGGGGAGAEQTSGQMLRPHLALERKLGEMGLRLELAQVEFPDQDVRSTELALGLSIPWEILHAREEKRSSAISDEALHGLPIRVRAIGASWSPDSGSSHRDGSPATESIQLLGVGLDCFLNENLYVPVELLGAAGGDAAGFAMIQAGLGLHVPVWNRVALEARASLGTGGGGALDTGGGHSLSAAAGAHVELGRRLGLELGWSKLDFPDGDYSADAFAASLTWSASLARLSRDYPRERLAREGLGHGEADVVTTRFALVDKLYLPDSGARKNDGSDYDDVLQLVGVRIEQPVWGDLAVTGAAYSAWDGNIGGYAEGLFGLKTELRPFENERHAFSASAEVGAGGGGGADVGSGLIYEFAVGYRYELKRDLSLVVEAGRIESDQGSFDADMLQVGIAWNLGHALRK